MYECRLIRKEKTLRLTRDIIGKPINDKFGFKFGYINDLSIPNIVNENFPIVNGLLIGRKFIPWTSVSFDEKNFSLKESISKNEICPIPNNVILLRRKILDEQLIDQYGRYIGRVDDIKLSYDVDTRSLKLIGFYSGIFGAFLRLGFEFCKDVISWQCVSQIKNEPPRGIVLKARRNISVPGQRYVAYASSI